jgi:hypothetical protein
MFADASLSFRRKPESSFNTSCEALETGFVSFGRLFELDSDLRRNDGEGRSGITITSRLLFERGNALAHSSARLRALIGIKQE